MQELPNTLNERHQRYNILIQEGLGDSFQVISSDAVPPKGWIKVFNKKPSKRQVENTFLYLGLVWN